MCRGFSKKTKIQYVFIFVALFFLFVAGAEASQKVGSCNLYHRDLMNDVVLTCAVRDSSDVAWHWNDSISIVVL